MKKKKEKKLTNEERLQAALANSVSLMGDIKPVTDNKLHTNDLDIALGDFVPQQNIYDGITQEELDNNINKGKEDLSKFIDENTENYVDFDERLDGDRENLFYQNLNKKYMDYIDSVQTRKKEQNIKPEKVRLPWFRKIRIKLASELFEHKLKASDNAAGLRFKRVITDDFYEHLSWGDEKLLRSFFEGKTQLSSAQAKEFLTFGKAWRLFVLAIKSKCERMKYNLYLKLHGLILKCVKNRDYYGHSDLEEMLNSTGGLPYSTLLSNHGIDPDCMNYIVDTNIDSYGKVTDIRKELLKQKIDATLPKPVNFNIGDFFKNLDDEPEIAYQKDVPTKENVEDAVKKTNELIDTGLTEENTTENLEKV